MNDVPMTENDLIQNLSTEIDKRLGHFDDILRSIEESDQQYERLKLNIVKESIDLYEDLESSIANGDFGFDNDTYNEMTKIASELRGAIIDADIQIVEFDPSASVPDKELCDVEYIKCPPDHEEMELCTIMRKNAYIYNDRTIRKQYVGLYKRI